MRATAGAEVANYINSGRYLRIASFYFAMKGMININKSPLIPDSMNAAEAAKMLHVLKISTLLVKAGLIEALTERSKGAIAESHILSMDEILPQY